jgi:hypothetical protein
MGREAEDRIAEGAAFIDVDRDIYHLSQELSCLIDLARLTSEDETAFSVVLDGLRTLLVSARSTQAPVNAYRYDLSQMAMLLAADLDLAYQRMA